MSDADEYAAVAAQLEAAGPESKPLHFEALGATLLGEFKQAELDRRDTEERWLKDLRQYKGRYNPEELAGMVPGKSRAFVRKTRVKVKTVDSRIMDLLFPAGVEKNWELRATPKPSLSSDQLAEVRKMLSARAAAMAQPGQPVPKLTRSMFDDAVREWAGERAKKMAVAIDDQLAEAGFKEVCKKAIHSGNLYGTGIVKGPLVERKVRTRFVRTGGKWLPQSETFVTPFLDFVPLWRFYPDMSASELQHCQFVWERHTMTRRGMADLASRRSFDGAKIKAHVLANADGLSEQRYTEEQLKEIGDRSTQAAKGKGLYDVLERWGYLSGDQLRQAGVEVPDERLHEGFFSNVWMLPSGVVIKAVLQPVNGVTWPYHIYYFDKDESSIFGEGLASIMRDDQSMLNSSTRLMFDNAAISAGPQLEVNPHLLSTVDKVNEHHPWKVWLRNNTQPGVQAVRAIELPSRLGDLGALAEMSENNADEVTAIPRYMGGENVSNGAAGTSSGLSMLMGNVNIVLKDLVFNWDVGVTCSFIKSLYHWNMQFNPDDAIKGDFDAVPRGVASLVAKEVRAQALDRFAQMTTNELDAPFIKRDELNRQRAEVNELVGVVKTAEELKAEQADQTLQAQQQLQMQLQQAQLAETQARAAKMAAEAEVAKRKLDEMMANIELTISKAVETRVNAAYAALQAGGVATSSPFTAPAGDEILRSAGWTDKTPDPSIAQLGGPPVQAQQVSRNLSQQVSQQADGNDALAQPAAPAQPQLGAAPDLQPQTGMRGHHAGIQTAELG